MSSVLFAPNLYRHFRSADFRFNYKNGKRNGIARRWHENGQLRGESNYKDGKLDGIAREWHENGQLREESNYKDSKLDGAKRCWYDDGNPYYEENYKDGRLDGIQREWGVDGNLKSERYYENGVEKPMPEEHRTLFKVDGEISTIVSESKANGTYHKAPNGKESNLSEEQWAVVRTKAFKEWFGDWELSSIREFLINAEPVSVVNDNPFSKKEGITFIEQVTQYFANQGGKASTIWGEVLLDKKGIKNDIGHGIGQVKAKSFASVKDVLENGRVVMQLKNHNVHEKKQQTGAIAAPIMIDGERYVCVVEVIKNKENNRLYVHEATIQKNLLDFRSNPSQSHSEILATHQGEMAKILQNIFSAKESSKIVDENGEPKVLIHNSSASDITEFRPGVGNAMYFADEVAQNYVEGFERGGYNYEVFLNVKNPHTDSYEPTYIDEEEGIDGVFVSGETEEGIGYAAIVKSPNQIKSAEPVTYDGNGEVVPLSERFKGEKSDIRFKVVDAKVEADDAKRTIKVSYLEDGKNKPTETTYRRYKGNVGKEIGGKIYLHKDYATEVIPKDVYDKAVAIAEKNGISFNTVVYNPKKPSVVRFDESADFDISREPTPGKLYTIDTETGEIKQSKTQQIFHHKWQWVKDDYKGFDVDESYEWSKRWLERIAQPSGYQHKWDAELESVGLPTESGSKVRFRTSTEIEREYPNWMEGATYSDGRHTTQIDGTRKTYNKVGEWIEENLGKDVSILDASSGLGYGTLDLREKGFNIEDVEPYQSAERKQTNPATYSSYGDIHKKYDFIISNAVLNVIPDDWRADVLHNMAKLMKDGGKMFINTRKAGGEKTIKDKIELDSPNEVLVKRNGKISSYQRFYTPKELKAWVESELGGGYKVEVANKKNSNTESLAAVVVTKIGSDNNEGGTRFAIAKTEEEFRNNLDRAIEENGFVMDGIENHQFNVLEVSKHDFKGTGKQAISQAREWAKDNLLGEHEYHKGQDDSFRYTIDNSAIGKFLSETSTKRSENLGAHLAILKDLIRVIDNSVDVEIHPDYKKDGERGIENGIDNPNMLVHRMYGAVNIDDKLYITKTTIYEQWDAKNKVHDYRITEIEPVISGSSASDALTSRTSVSATKLLKDINKSYKNEKIISNNTRFSIDLGDNITIGGRTLPIVGESRALAAEHYNRALESVLGQQQEIWQDNLHSLDVLQREVAKATGERILGFENAYQALIIHSSKTRAEVDRYMANEYKDLLAVVRELGGADKKKYKEITTYMKLKHGLERNEKFALRDAQKDAQKQIGKYKQEQQAKLDVYKQERDDIINRVMSGNATQDDVTRRAELDVWITKLTQDLADDKKLLASLENKLYNQYRKKDYSGLTDITGEKKVADAEMVAEQMVSDFEANHRTDKLWDAVKTATAYSVRMAHQGGLISEATRNSIIDMFEYYIPLRGWEATTAEDVYSYIGRNDDPYQGNVIKHASGRKSESADPLSHIAAMAAGAVSQANKNLAKLQFLALAENHPTDLLSVSEVYVAPSPLHAGENVLVFPEIPEDATAEEVKNIMTGFTEYMKNNPTEYTQVTHGKGADIPYRIEWPQHKASHIVMVKRNGKPYFVVVNGNPRAAEAINGKTNPGANNGVILESAQKLGRFMSQNFTTRNASFVPANLLMDGVYSTTMSFVRLLIRASFRSSALRVAVLDWLYDLRNSPKVVGT